jgi:PKD repeat protein/uncharacterized pyridoxamine 5'-phosphate oxidase family protein
MKKQYVFLLLLIFGLTAFSQQKEVDAYKLEADGYFTTFYKWDNKLFFTDNYASRIYELSDDNKVLRAIEEAPGCGRYMRLKNGKILYKHIDPVTMKQVPMLYDVNSKSFSKLHSPVSLCGQPDISDLGDVIFTVDNTLHVINNNGGHKSFDLGGYSNFVRISPDGNYAAYNTMNDELAIINLESGEKHVFTSKGFVYPVWSPDSKKIAFNSVQGDLFVYDLTTGQTWQIDKGGKEQWISNEKLVYQHNVDSNLVFYGSDLFVAKFDGSEKINLTNTPDDFEISPYVVGNKIYFSSYNTRKIYVADFNGNEINNVQVYYDYSTKKQVYKIFKLSKSKSKSIVHIPNVPYVHQRYDTPSWHNGSGSCAPTTSIMAIAFYNRLPQWPTVVDHGYSFDPHTSVYGSYIADKYHFNEIYYDIYEQTTSGTDAWGGYGYMWDGSYSPNSRMRQYIENHKMTSEQLWTSSCTFTNTTNEIDNGYVHPICAYITSAGHLILARGYVVGQHTLIFNDPAGDKNAAPYFNYYGTDAYYDWPGYNNGYQNLDPDGSHGGVAWTVTAETSQPNYNDTIIDNDYYGHGFYMNNSQNGAHMRYFRDYNGGYNNHCWYTLTMADASDVCWVTWTPNLHQDGAYEVSVYIPDNHANATNAMYHVFSDDGENIVHIDQSAYSNQWVSLGVYNFTQGQNGHVYLGDSTGTDYNEIAFDAVKWEKMPTGLDFVVNDVSCNGGNDGSITVNPTEGTPPYTYVWNTNPPQTTQTATNLTAGTYSVTVSDDNGNTYTGSATVNEPDPIVNSISVQSPSQSGSSDGSITVSTAGGTPPYSYNWNPSVSTTNSASGLAEGTYIITTTDANGCYRIDTVELNVGNCPMPQNLTLVTTTSMTATIEWDGSAQTYLVAIAEQGSNDWTYYTVDTTSFTFSGLAANTTYDCSVASICGTDTTASISTSFTTQAVTNITLTECTGVFTDDGGANGNYSSNMLYEVTIQPTNATKISITFDYANIEANYDTLFIYDGPTTSSPLIRYISGNVGSFTIVSSGNALTFKFKSDGATEMSGWLAKWTSYGGDCNCIPVSQSDSTDVWRTSDYYQTFTDEANTPLGFKERFYDVIYYENNRWTGNGVLGFFNENFDLPTIDTSIWTVVSGTWNIESNHLVQTDESLSNNNIFARVEQDNQHSYLYHWYMAMTGTGTNRRAGIYIFADDDSSSNRGNSYMVWYRLDNDLVQIYKVHSDGSYDLVTSDPFDFDDGAWYDYKVYFNPQTGELSTYINGIKVSSWVDPSPYQAGHYISLRVGNARVYYDDVKVYKSRGSSALVSVGANIDDAIRVQSINGQPVARVKTMIMNALEHFSDLDGNELMIDWTPPAAVTYVYDGTGADIDTTFDPHTLSANWSSSSDENSGIESYWYAIGTTPGGTDVQDWDSNGMDTTVTASGFVTLQNNVTYYITVKAKNGAGLFSDEVSSDGQLASLDPVIAFDVDNHDVCVGDTVQFYNNTLYAVSYTWIFDGGTPSSSTDENPTVIYTQPGTYDVTLIAYNASGVNFALTEHNFITVHAAPVAEFTFTPQNLTLPDSLVVFTNNSENATSYLWNFGDGDTSIDINPYHVYTEPGTYDVTLIAYNDYCEPDTASANVSVVSGVEEAGYNSEISISPNPAHNYLEIDWSDNVFKADIEKITITSADGKTLRTINKLYNNKVDVSALPTGTYFLNLYTKEGKKSVKFIKK